ncbi:25729_t:CDS:2, partial [Gigaspora rosea]
EYSCNTLAMRHQGSPSDESKTTHNNSGIIVEITDVVGRIFSIVRRDRLHLKEYSCNPLAR